MLAPRAGLALAAVGALGYGAFRTCGGAAALDGVTETTSFTFALYLFHYPLLHLYAAALEHASLESWRGAVVIPATLMSVWLLGLATERRKAGLKRWLWTLAKRRRFQPSSGIR